MGRSGAGFAQGFASTLAQGLQVQEQIRSRQEDLELKKKLVGAQLQEHEAKTKLAERALTASTTLQELLTATEPTPRAGTMLDLGDTPEAAGTMPARRPAPVSRRSLAAAIAGADPVKAAEIAAMGEPLTPERLTALLAPMTAPGGVTIPSEPAVGGEATARAPVPGVTELPQIRVNISSKGELSASLGTERLQNPMQITEITTPHGEIQKMAVVRDLATGQIYTLPLGLAVPPTVIQEAARLVDAQGGEKLALADRELFVAQTAAVMANPDKDVKQELLAQLGEQISQAASQPGRASSRPLNLRGAQEAVETRRQKRIGQETQAREAATFRSGEDFYKRTTLKPAPAGLSPAELTKDYIFVPKGLVPSRAILEQNLLDAERVIQKRADLFPPATGHAAQDIANRRLAQVQGFVAREQGDADVQTLDSLRGMMMQIQRAFGGTSRQMDSIIELYRTELAFNVTPGSQRASTEQLRVLRSRLNETYGAHGLPPMKALQQAKGDKPQTTPKANFRWDPATNRLIPIP